MRVRSLVLRAGLAAALAGTVSAAALAAAPAKAPAPAAPHANPCSGVKNCKPTEGPWVAVPASGEADFLLECPKRSGTIGGIDILTDSSDVRVTWQANSGSPVRPGTSTDFFAYFQAYSATGKPGLFQPYIGCIPEQKVKPRATVSARVAPAPAVTHPGAFLDRRQTLYALKSGTTQTASQACGKNERLLTGWYAIAYGTSTPPPADLSSKVHVSVAVEGGKVVATASTDTTMPKSASAELQVGALCSS
jgi:hypothetical protein